MKRLIVLLLGLGAEFISANVAHAVDDWRNKIGVYVTPPSEGDSRFPVGYSDAIKTLQGHAATVWVLESWQAIETAPGQYDWHSLDTRVNKAIDAGFSVGMRIQIILSGNNAKKQWVGVSRIPSFYSQDMRSQQFREKAAAFYSQLAQRYKGKVRYIAVGNTVNKYFEKNPSQWDGFQQAYNPIVDAIHQAAPGLLVVADINSGGEFFTHPERLKKYVDFFAQSHDDLLGLVFYFIAKEYYGGDFHNFNIDTFQHVLEQLHAMEPNKPLYLIETACFSRNAKTGKDISGVQARYVHMLMATAREKDYLAGFSWWLLYDGENSPQVPWDIKAGFGLFDSAGHPKEAWTKWTEAYARN